ncbi:CchlT [Streptomyces sp. SID11233]|nr:CchlT [Streptomyces sp. SID11233]
MRDIVFTRQSGWIPNVIREDGELKLMLGAGADANHEPRTFTFSIGEAHLAVIREDLARHLLLWSAVLPLCDAAGTRGRLDENAAITLLDPVLLATPADVDALFRRIPWDRGRLIAHGADIGLLGRGQVCAAMRAATEASNEKRAQEYHANRRRTERGAVLGPLDTALLKYTGQYLHGSTVPKRIPDAVDPALLPEVIRVIATAEQAGAGMRIGRDPRRGKRATDKQDWDRMAAAVDAAVRRAHPDLVDEAVRTVGFLMCSEAADRSRSSPMEDDAETAGDRAHSGVGARKRILSFTDDKGVERKWLPGSPRTAAADFWEFVGDRSAADNEVFTIEDEERGEGIQVHFYADSVARVTTVREGAGGGSDPEYRVEYSLVDGIGGYRKLVSAFVRGGCAALDYHGPWMSDAAEFERARRRRHAG